MKESNYPYTDQGKRLKIIRKKLRLSQKDMAKDLEVKPGSLSDVERGRRNISRTLEIKLVALYKISINFLRYGTKPIFDADSPHASSISSISEPQIPYESPKHTERIKELEVEVRKLQEELLQAKDEIIRLLRKINEQNIHLDK